MSASDLTPQEERDSFSAMKMFSPLRIPALLLLFGTFSAAAQSASGGVHPHGWPRTFTNDGTAFTVYQPQATSWTNGILTFREAVSVLPQGAAQPSFGTLTLSATTDVDSESQTLALSAVSVVQDNFPSLPDQADNYASQLANQAGLWGQNLSLQVVKANLAVNAAEGNSSKPVAVKNTPPTIYFSEKPALLVLVDGEPALRAVEGSSLLRVINTQALLALDQSSGLYYLRINGGWAQASALSGPWTSSANPPDGLSGLLEQAQSTGNVQLFDPPQNSGTGTAPSLPAIYVSATPAELITTKGKPAFEQVGATQLLHATNTGSSLFLDLANQSYYVVISGRWFSSPALTGATASWQFVPANQLPADFANIPENAPAGTVLASVAGTSQAAEAAISSTIPQTATISRSASTNVSYDGDPQFEQIVGTDLSYARNTATPVVRIAPNSYYAVVNGIWFKAPSPAGPWVVAENVPPVIYTIPPSCPIYYVTSVFVYHATPDYVYVGYTPGYFGTCLSPEGVVVYGTGYYYPPYIGPSLWIGPPLTYGFGAGFACGLATGFAFGVAADHGWGCSPWWGPWHGGWGSWNGGGWNNGNTWNRNSGNSYTRNVNNWNNVNVSNHNVYNRWGGNVVKNNHSISQNQIHNAQNSTQYQRAKNDYNQGKSNYESNHPDSHASNGTHHSLPDRQTLSTDSSHLGDNNVFAGKDGNAYRSTKKGGWQQHSSSGWKDVPHQKMPESTHSDLNSQRYARNVGNLRSSGGDFGGENRGEGRGGGRNRR